MNRQRLVVAGLAFGFLVLASMISVGAANAAPLSVRIDDHDFTFDTGVDAEYLFNGAAADQLRVLGQGLQGPPHYEVGSYRYLGVSPTPVAAVGPGFYPVANLLGGPLFGGDLELDLFFSAADSPYQNPAGDKLDVSLTGTTGRLKITGEILQPNFAPFASPVVGTLLEIEFDKTSLITRDNTSVIDMVEAWGRVQTLLGEDITTDVEGVVFLKFFAEDAQAVIFPAPGERYDPLVEYDLNDVRGRVSGEAGDGVFTIPEPAAIGLLALGMLGLVCHCCRGR